MSEIQDFKIDIPKEKLVDLQKRLEMTRWPEKETPDDWTQGIPLSYICLLYTSPSPRDGLLSRMPSSA